MKFFDIQLFADENVEIPEELEGISPETAAEIMKEAGISKETSEETKEEEQPEEQDNQAADADSDNKQVEESPENKTQENEEGKEPANIPYKRFKEINEKAKAKDAEIAALKAQIEAAQQQRNSQQQLPQQNQLPQQMQQQSERNPQNEIALMQEIYKAAREEAKKVTGFTDEDIANIEYDDTGKNELWNQTLQFKLAQINQDVQTEIKRREQETFNFQKTIQTSYAQFNEFSNNLAKEADFEQVKNHALNDYFTSLPEFLQTVVKEAYEKVGKENCSPKDLAIVQNYINAAKNDYRLKNQTTQQQQPPSTNKEKIKQMEAHPKVSQIQGSNTAGGTTIADIERMVDTMEWDKIPQEIRDIAMGK